MEQSATTHTATQQITPKRSSIFSNRNFVLLWLGQGTSVIGDQFHMIALPWLVLILTGDPVQLGLILALIGVPRAIFMLAGGAVTDRFSQRSVMLASDVLRLGLTALLAAMIFSNHIELWMLYAFAIVFGTVSAFFIPASGSIVPRIVNSEQLMTGNSIVQGTATLSAFIGPLLAGGLIALFTTAQAGSSPSTFGIGLAIAIDSATFLVSVITLWLMQVEKPQTRTTARTGFLQSIVEGFTFILGTRKILYMFLILAALNFLFSGPVIVGIPIIASTRLTEGAAAFGIIMAAFAAGNLLGYLGSSAIKIKPRNIGPTSVGFIGLFGAG
ncbi:MAG TPA: MFS transporter, partial [Methanocella sp.]|nr:MFS transporter [Methanocella sp.]